MANLPWLTSLEFYFGVHGNHQEDQGSDYRE